jgi:hypothetical protein
VTFAAGSFTHSLLGNWIKQGNCASGSGAIQLAGTQDAAINGATTFGTLTVNKTGVGNVITMSDNLGVGTLNILAGTLLTGTNELTITVDRTGPGIILGTITRTHAFSPGVAYAFEGPNNTILFSSLLDIGSITETVTLGPVRDFPFGGSINRQYLLNVSSGGPYSATLRLHYLDSGLNGNSESIMQLWSSFGGWAASGKTANDPINNWVEQSALTDLSGRWTGALSSAWENPGNWTAAKGAPQIPPSTNDIVEIAGTSYLAQPTISTPVTVRSLSLGSAQAMTLTLAPGGSLNLSGNGGNVTAAWSNNVVHTINVGAQSLSTAGILALSDGTNGHAINLNIGSGTVQVGDDFSVSGGAQVGFTGPGRLQVGGDFLFNGGTLNSGTGTVEYNGQGPQIVAGGIAYNNLAFNKAGGAATLSTPATVLGDLVLSNASTLLMNATLTVSNNVVIGPGAILNGDASTLKVGGNWTRVGTFIPNLGTVEFNGPGQQTIQSTTFNNLSVNKLSGGATAAANLVLNGDLNLTSGVLDLFTNTITRGAFGGALNMGPGSVLRIGTGSSFPSDFATRAIDPASTVEFNGTGPQIVSDNGYGNLAFSNGGSNPKVLGGNVAVAGDLIINSGASLFGGTYALLVHGNWTNNGSFFPATGSVSLVGNGKNLAGPTTFNQLTVSGNYVATSDITVNNSAIISGSLAAGSTTDTFSGDFSCLGSFSNSGIVTFSVTGPQIINLGSGFASSGTLNFNGSVAPALVSQPLVLNNVNINNIGGMADWGTIPLSAPSTTMAQC